MTIEPQWYRKKPVAVQAVQVDTNNYDEMCEIVEWCQGTPVESTTYHGHGNFDTEPVISIRTMEGTMYARHGDWIIRGVQGEFYPCKPDIFVETYESLGRDGTEWLPK